MKKMKHGAKKERNDIDIPKRLKLEDIFSFGFVVVFFLVCLIGFATFLWTITTDEPLYFDASKVGSNAATSSDVFEEVVIRDIKEKEAPKKLDEKAFEEIYKAEHDGVPKAIYQIDEEWADYPYADDTIGESGCGLVCAAIAIEALTGDDVSPSKLAERVGDTCLTDGTNDMAKFIEYMNKTYPGYGIKSDGIYFDAEKALENAKSDKLVFASLVGYFGDSFYDGHLIVIKGTDGEGFIVRDPHSIGNSCRSFTYDELAHVDWVYFYTVEGLG